MKKNKNALYVKNPGDHWPGGIAPRIHAEKYIRLNKQQRAIYFESIPDELKDFVKFYVKDYFEKKKHVKQL